MPRRPRRRPPKIQARSTAQKKRILGQGAGSARRYYPTSTTSSTSSRRSSTAPRPDGNDRVGVRCGRRGRGGAVPDAREREAREAGVVPQTSPIDIKFVPPQLPPTTTTTDATDLPVGVNLGSRLGGALPTPSTKPPVTAPPVTAPPVTAAPVTAPPVTAPPVTAPPVTAPPPRRASGHAPAGRADRGSLRLDDPTARMAFAPSRGSSVADQTPVRLSRSRPPRPLATVLFVGANVFVVIASRTSSSAAATCPRSPARAARLPRRRRARPRDGGDRFGIAIVFLYAGNYARTHRSWLRSRSWNRKHGRV